MEPQPVNDEWPEWLSFEYTALHRTIKNCMIDALAHCYESADAAGMNWTRDGWISVSASNVLSWMRRMGLPAPVVPMPEQRSARDVERAWMSEWSPDDADEPSLAEWLAADREGRLATIEVRAGDPEWSDDDVLVAQPFEYTVKLEEMEFWADPRPANQVDVPYAYVTWAGRGATQDEAIAEALRCRAEHKALPS